MLSQFFFLVVFYSYLKDFELVVGSNCKEYMTSFIFSFIIVWKHWRCRAEWYEEYLKVSVAVKKHHDHRNCCKGKHFIVVFHLQFWYLVYYDSRKQGNMQADMVLKQ